jgi:EF hand
MPFRGAFLFALVAFALAAAPLAAQQQPPPPWSPWGGPDSPGGLFGGDPQEAAGDQDRPINRDEVWSWLMRRFEAADTDRDRAVTPGELKITPLETHRQAWFHRADADRNGRLTPDELQALAGLIVLFHDTDRDGLLHRREIERRPAPPDVRPRPATPDHRPP